MSVSELQQQPLKRTYNYWQTGWPQLKTDPDSTTSDWLGYRRELKRATLLNEFISETLGIDPTPGGIEMDTGSGHGWKWGTRIMLLGPAVVLNLILTKKASD